MSKLKTFEFELELTNNETISVLLQAPNEIMAVAKITGRKVNVSVAGEIIHSQAIVKVNYTELEDESKYSNFFKKFESKLVALRLHE